MTTHPGYTPMDTATRHEGEKAATAGDRGTRIALSLLLVITVVVLYGPLARYSFVQDDWRVIHRFVLGEPSRVIGEILSPAGKFFYRPLAGLYCYCVYSVFGLNPAGFHVLSLFLLAGSSLLVVAVARALSGDRVVAWGSGFLYAAAANVQFEPQMWMVGSYDTGAVLFSLLSLLALLKGRFGLSALAMAGALACKESAAPIVAVAAAWMFILGDARSIPGKLKWHALVFAAFLAVKLAGVSPFSLPPTDPYAARLTGGHLLANGELYGTWAIQAVTPMKNVLFTEGEKRAAVLLALGLLALVSLGAPLFSARSGFRGGIATRAGLCASAWAFLMIIPPLLLTGHIVTYYLAPALPGLAIGTMLALASAARVLFRNARVTLVLCAFLAALCAIDAFVMVERRMALGRSDGVHATNRDGDDHLVRKAIVAGETRDRLLNLLPSLPAHTLLLMDGVQIGCFAGRYGLQTWYGDSTLLLSEEVRGPDSAGNVSATLPGDEGGGTTVVVVPVRTLVHVSVSGDSVSLVGRGPG